MGHDKREALAYDVAKYSILSRTNANVRITPIERITTKHLFDRPTEKRGEQLWDVISDAPMSTEFAIARFAIPFLAHGGWVLFIDPDVVCRTDIQELFNLTDNKYAVMCVKHIHIPTEEAKFHDAGMIQTAYRRKNWSSVVLWNLDHPGNKRLTLKELNEWPGRDLHGFNWLEDQEIGELEQKWNFLVGVNEGVLEDQNILHFTDGTPAWEDWEPKSTDYLWNKELEFLKESDTISKSLTYHEFNKSRNNLQSINTIN